MERKCPQCGRDVSPSAQFCLQCGSALPPRQIEPGQRIPWDPDRYRRDVIMASIISATVIAIIAAMAVALLSRKSEQSSEQKVLYSSPAVTVVEAPAKSSLTRSPPSLPQPTPVQKPKPKPKPPTSVQQPREVMRIIERTAPQKPQVIQQPSVQVTKPQPQQPMPPADILAYLRALERIERKRRSLSSGAGGVFELLNAAIGLVQSINPEAADSAQADASRQRITAGFARYRMAYLQLLRQFRAIPPPTACQQLALSYERALVMHVQTIQELEQAMATRDISKPLFALLTVDRKLKSALNVADNALATVCYRYSIPKFFRIGD